MIRILNVMSFLLYSTQIILEYINLNRMWIKSLFFFTCVHLRLLRVMRWAISVASELLKWAARCVPTYVKGYKWKLAKSFVTINESVNNTIIILKWKRNLRYDKGALWQWAEVNGQNLGSVMTRNIISCISSVFKHSYRST